MNTLIKVIWHQPEILTWQRIYQRTSPKVLAAPARPVAVAADWAASRQARAAASADQKCQIVLEYIWNWNLTWWQRALLFTQRPT